MIRRGLYILLTFWSGFILAQPAGGNGFSILNFSSGARVSALGGNAVGLSTDDLVLATENPGLVDSIAIGDFSLGYSPFFGGINLLQAHYAFEVSGVGPFVGSISYLNYGEFTQTDLVGNDLGVFSPQDYLLQISKSHRLGSFSIGSTLKFVHSSIAGFGSSAIGLDLGGAYIHPIENLTVGVVIKNLGFVIEDFSGAENSLPLDLQVGIGFRPKYMPVRFSATVHSLVNDNLSYFNDGIDDVSDPSGLDKAFRHVNLGLEFLVGQSVNLLVGYNHLRREELRQVQGAYGAGISFGLMIKIKKLQFRFSRATYHAAGGINSIGVQGNLSNFKKKF